MPAEVLFAGGRLDSVLAAVGAPYENTSATYRDTTYTDASVIFPNVNDAVTFDLQTQTANVLSNTTVVSGESFWLHFDGYMQNTFQTGGIWITLSDSSGFPWFRIANPSNGDCRAQWNSGTGASPVWTSFAGNILPALATRQTFDLRIIIGSPHTYEWYVNGSLVATNTFTQALFTNIARVRYSNPSSNFTAVSQLMATRDISTIGAKVKTCRATGAGANTAWTGVFSDVNEAVGNDATINQSLTAGQKESHVMEDVTVPVGMEIKSVFLWNRAKNDGSAPTKLRSLLRSGGIDYVTGDLSGIGFGYAPVGARYDQDPATVANWTEAGWNAMEAGYESAT